MTDEISMDVSTNVDMENKRISDERRTKYFLYTAMALSAWGDRMWNFSVGIYFISLNPTNLQVVAINGIALNLAVILLGAMIGSWIDRNPRLSALRQALYFQNLSVAVMAVLVVIALYNESVLSTFWMFIIQGFLIGIGVIAVLSSVACKVSISKDWVVALYGSNRENLASTNATLRRIDLVSGVLAPVLTGAVMAFTTRWISAVIIAGWNVISLGFELLLYTKVYNSAKHILSVKPTVKPSEKSKSIDKNNVHKGKIYICQDLAKTSKSKTQKIAKIFSFANGLKTYFSLPVCLPGLSLALLYMTVLSFDSVTRAYVIEQGLSEVILGVLNGIGSILGIIGTLMYPIFVKRTGLVRTGIIGFWSEFLMLIFCLLSLFVYGTSFTPFQHLTIGSCHIYNAMKNSTAVTNTVLHPCSNSKFSVILLVIGITLNRFGLWIADLTVNQLQQERVPEKVRGLIGGTQHSFNQFFDMLRYVLIIIFPRMSQFGYHICLSVLSVFTASLIYSIWSCSPASSLVPPTTDVEMKDLNADADLAAHFETHLGEKLPYADEDPDKMDNKA